MREFFISDKNEFIINQDLPRPYKDDSEVDFSTWEIKPSPALQAVVGNLSDIRTLTTFKVVQIAAEVIHLFTSSDTHVVDRKYAKGALNFVVHNRRELGMVTPEEDKFTSALYTAIGVAEYEGRSNSSGQISLV